MIMSQLHQTSHDSDALASHYYSNLQISDFGHKVKVEKCDHCLKTMQKNKILFIFKHLETFHTHEEQMAVGCLCF